MAQALEIPVERRRDRRGRIGRGAGVDVTGQCEVAGAVGGNARRQPGQIILQHITGAVDGQTPRRAIGGTGEGDSGEGVATEVMSLPDANL